MADPAQLAAPAPGSDVEATATPSGPGVPAMGGKAANAPDVPVTLAADALPQMTGNGPAVDVGGAPAEASPLPVPATIDRPVQSTADKPSPAPPPKEETRPERAAAQADPVPALLQQAGRPAPALAALSAGGKEPVKPTKKDGSGMGASKTDDADNSAQTAPLAADPAQAAASQAPATAAPAAAPATAADPTVTTPAAEAAPTVTAATTLPRPALPAFQPAAPRPALPVDATPGKNDDRTGALAAPPTSDPQGILPPADKPDPAAVVERKLDGAPAPRHHAAAELRARASDNRTAAQDPLPNPASLAGNSAAPAAAAGTHTNSAAGGATAASGPQNQLQLQQPVPLSGVPVLIAAKALAGDKHFDIRLDPPELGRIEVRLKVDREGQVSSHLIADRPDTLALLRRDGAGLERALQDAGFKTAGDGLQFSLRDQSGNGQGDGRSAPRSLAAEQDTRLDPPASTYIRYSGRVGGLDIRV